MWQWCELPYTFHSSSLHGLMNEVKSTHHTIDHFGSVKYAELVDPVLFSQTSTLLWKISDKLHVHCDVTHKNNFLYPVITVWTAGAKFPPEYSNRNLIVKTRCVKQMWLSGNCKASLFVFVSSKTQLARLIQSSLQQPLQHGTVAAVFLYDLLLLYLSLIPIPQNSAHYLTFPLDT